MIFNTRAALSAIISPPVPSCIRRVIDSRRTVTVLAFPRRTRWEAQMEPHKYRVLLWSGVTLGTMLLALLVKPVSTHSAGAKPMSQEKYSKPSDEQLRRSLTPIQYEVTQKAA